MPYTQCNPLKLFSFSSSGRVTRVLRGYFSGTFVYVSFHFKAKENLQRCGIPFLIFETLAVVFYVP